MASLLLFAILTSLISVLFIIDLPNSLANTVYYNEEYENEDYNNEGLDTNCNRASSKRPCYNPFGYKKCGSGKFRYNWMRESGSFYCGRDVGGSCRSGSEKLEKLEKLDDHSDEYRPIGKPRIDRGFFPELGEFPSFVQLFFYDRSANGSSIASSCGGTLINEYLVLTAAHCFTKVALGFAHAGSIKNWASKDFKGQRQLIKRACRPNPPPGNPNDKKTRYDWAILELDGQFELNQNVQPACLNLDYKLSRNFKCVAVGFGETKINTEVRSPLMKAAVVMDANERWASEPGFIWASEVFPDRFEVGSGVPCPGDRGGPLYCYENCSGELKMYVVGVASFADERRPPCHWWTEFAYVNTVSYRKLMPSLIKDMMHKREKRSVRIDNPMDHTPLTREGFRCVNFEVGQG